MSGSMGGELPLIYGALAPLLGYLHPDIHLFSTGVENINHAQLRAGGVKTSWGTDIACVSNHILGSGARRALLITDGWVGEVPDEHRCSLRRRGVRVNTVLTHNGDGEFARALKGRVQRLPHLN